MRAPLRLAVAATAALTLGGTVLAPATSAAPGGSAAGPAAGPDRANPSGRTVELTLAGSHETGVFDGSAAEIPAFDPSTDRLFVVNASAGAVDVLQVGADGVPTFETSLATAGRAAADGSTVDAGAVVNSVAVAGGLLAVAVQAEDKTDHGWVLFYATADLSYLGGVRAGALPDSLAFAPHGGTVVVANEGEPADDFSTDPEGTISVIDVPRSMRQFDRLSQASVRTVDFRQFDAGTPLPDGVRVFGPDVAVPEGQEPAGSVARNLEPEYVTVDPTGRTAYVSVQEANAIAVVDLRSATLTDLWALELTDWSVDGTLDVSDRDGAIQRAHWPVLGVPMPDGLDTYRWRGQDLVVTANEGDSREWGDFIDAERVKDLELCEPGDLQADEHLGRLNAVTDLGYDAERGCYTQLHAFGSRSFSIYTADGERLFDSAGLIEQTVEELIAAGELPEHAFNANNDETPSFDARSDDKGPEPEDVVVGQVQGRTYAFVGLERIGGVMVFDVTDPRAVSYVAYVNDRTWDAVGEDGSAGLGDLGAEGLAFVPASASPTGEALLVVAHEVSGTTSVYEVTPSRGR